MENKGFKLKRHSSLNKFIGINGVTFYNQSKKESCSYEDFIKLADSKKNVLDETTLKQSILRGTLSSPFNKRPLRTKDLVVISNKKVPGELNFVVSDDLTCLGSFDEGIFSEPVNIMLSVLTKHKKENPNSTWEYTSKTNQINKKLYNILITLPSKKTEYLAFINMFAEMAEVIKVVMGYKCVVNIVLPKKTIKFKQKEYSLILPVTLGVYIGSEILNHVSRSMLTALTEGNVYSPDVEKKLLGWAKRQKDLLVANIGDGSFYITREYYERNIKQKEKLLKSGNIKNPRTLTDYLAKAVSEDKDLVVFSDTNSTVVLAHELGHYIVSKKKFLKKLQNGPFWRFISRSNAFVAFVGLILGLTGNMVAGIISTILMKCPELISEFAASYYGMKIMKEIGCSKEDLRKAKSDFRKAYITYLNGTLGLSLTSVWGSVLGETIEIPTKLPELL